MSSKNVFFRLYQDSVKSKQSPIKLRQMRLSSPKPKAPLTDLEKVRISSYFRPSSPEFEPRQGDINLQVLPVQELPPLESIDSIRKQVNSRFSVQPEEPPDPVDVIQRNKQWALSRTQRIEERKKEISLKELDGCTFKPYIKRLRSTSNLRSPIRSPKRWSEKSYVELYRDKLIYRALSRV